jgi:hypothetical protein
MCRTRRNGRLPSFDLASAGINVGKSLETTADFLELNCVT